MNTCTSATASLPVQTRFITVWSDVPRLPLTSTGYSPIALIDVWGGASAGKQRRLAIGAPSQGDLFLPP